MLFINLKPVTLLTSHTPELAAGRRWMSGVGEAHAASGMKYLTFYLEFYEFLSVLFTDES